jgi:hypothetical protein
MTTKTNTTAPPSSLFTAVLFQFNKEGEQEALSPLQVPLLTSTKSSNTDSNNNTVSANNTASPWQDAAWVLRLKLVSFCTGSLSALLSQYVLSQTLWNESVLDRPLLPVIFFSLVWSFLTCVVVFSSMFLNVWILERRYNSNNNKSSNKSSKNKITKEWDQVVFQMEAHHVVGALLAISLAWIFVDVLRLAVHHTRVVHTGMFVALTVAAYGIFFRVMVSGNPAESQMMPTYQLLATTLGLIVGLCSQFVLSFSLWTEHMTVPVLSNVILFSVVWSLLTVLITFLGCVALRNLALDDDDYDDADDTDSAAKINSKKQAAIDIERIHLRMESHYVFAALIGICGAWILMDLVLDMPQQILPSLVMLAVALAAFTGIIYCFPEDQCLDEYAVTIDGQHEQQQQQTVVIVAVAVEEV